MAACNYGQIQSLVATVSKVFCLCMDAAAAIEQIELNMTTVIIDSIQFLVKQGLALRGSNWDKAANSEDGNFTSLLELMRKYSPQLKSHLENSPRMHGTCRLKSKTN